MRVGKNPTRVSLRPMPPVWAWSVPYMDKVWQEHEHQIVMATSNRDLRVVLTWRATSITIEARRDGARPIPSAVYSVFYVSFEQTVTVCGVYKTSLSVYHRFEGRKPGHKTSLFRRWSKFSHARESRRHQTLLTQEYTMTPVE